MKQLSMHAAVTTEYNKIEWRRVPVPVIEPDEVLIRVAYAGICGSDQHIYRGEFAPRTATPLIQGHEFGGTIEAVGEKVKDYRIGERVVVDPILPCGECSACRLGHDPACSALKLYGVDLDGGFAQYTRARSDRLFRITDKISDRHAALVELYSIGFHACNRAELGSGDTALIWGGGRVGQSILQAARTRTGEKIFVVDILQSRLDVAAQSSENVVAINARDLDPLETVVRETEGRMVDIAFEAVGHGVHVENVPDPVVGCVRAVRGGGTVCVLGLSDEPVRLVMKELIWGEARIVASRVSHGEFAEAIRYLDQGRLNPEALITSEMPGRRADEAFERLASRPDQELKVLLNFA